MTDYTHQKGIYCGFCSHSKSRHGVNGCTSPFEGEPCDCKRTAEEIIPTKKTPKNLLNRRNAS